MKLWYSQGLERSTASAAGRYKKGDLDMLGKKRKRTLASLLSIVLAMSCVLTAIPVGAYDSLEQTNVESAVTSEGSLPEPSKSSEDPEEEISKPVGDSDLEGSLEDFNGESSEMVSVITSDATPMSEDFLADDERVNLAAGMKYSGTEPYKEGATASYPDTGNKELTDGIYGASDYKDPMYVGYAGGNRDMELVFDFGYNQTFDEIRLYYACLAGAGVVPPARVEVSYSSDKLNWTPWAVGGPGEYGDTSHEYSLSGEPVTGRFVKIYVKYGLYWFLLSEVEIMGTWVARDLRQPVVTLDLPEKVNKYEGDTINLKMDYTIDKMGDDVTIVWKKDNVELPQFQDQKSIKISNAQVSDSGAYQAFIINRFNDGFEISGDSSACLVTITESDLGGDVPVIDIPDSDPNNLAFKKTYSISNSLDVDYQDAGQLTDGLYGSVEDYLDGRWLGFSKSKAATAEVTVDLGASQAIRQVEATFLRDEVAGAEWPTKVEVFTSDNKTSWKSAGTFAVKGVTTTETMVYNFQEKVNAAGRYVKFVATPGSKDITLIDEVRVLKTSNIPDKGEEEPSKPVDMSNDLAYGKSYTYSREPNSGYPDTGNKELTDGIHAPGKQFSKEPEWVGFLALPNGAGTEREDIAVTLDLGRVESFEGVSIEYCYDGGASILLPDAVKVEISSDGTEWQTVVEGTGKDISGGGMLKSFVYSDREGMTARYVKFTTTPTTRGWLFMDEIEVLKTVDVKVDPYNIVRDKGYTISRLPDNGEDGVLTDGRYGVTATAHDPNWVGFLRSKNASYNHVEMVFNLQGMHSISNITLYSREDAALKLTTPKNLKFYVSNDGKDWATLKTFNKGISTFGIEDNTAMTWDCENPNDAFISTSPEYTQPYTAYVKVAFDVPAEQGVYTYVDEIKVIGVNVKTANAGPCLGDGIDPYNLAFSKPYTLSPDEPVNANPDDGTKLTDGNKGAYDFSDPAWVQFVQAKPLSGKQVDRWPFKTIVVDLEETCSISKIVMSMCSGAGDGGKKTPWSIYMHASMDGENWMPLYTINNISDSRGLHHYGWQDPDETSGKSQNLTGVEDGVFQARYVRVDIELKSSQMVDEIEIYGVKGVTDESRPLTNLTKLENGRDYMIASDETTNGVRDMVLCYNGWYGYQSDSNSYRGDWTPEKYRPYLTYVDSEGKVIDKMFDTVCLLGLRSRYGKVYSNVWGNEEKAGPADWEWYLDKTFKEGGDVDNLNKAAKRASEELGDPNYKIQLVVMFPSIDELITNFGSLDGSKNLNFSEAADREYATDWWIDRVFTEMLSGKYEYIDFKGMYELNEQLDFRESVRYASEKTHSYGDYYYYWIPHYRSSGYMWGKDYGIDCTAFQPNHFFEQPEDEMDFGAGGTKQVETALKIAAYSNIGLEMEFDDNLFTRPSWYNLGLDYLNAVVKLGADGDKCYRNWYEGGGTLGKVAASKDPVMREFYDNCYQLMHGTYVPREYITEYPSGSDPKRAGFNMDVFYGPGFEDNGTSSGGSTAGGSIGGGGSTTPSKPDVDKPDTPSDEEYTWEEVDGSFKLKGADGEYVTGWAKIGGKWYYLNTDGVRETGWQKIDNKWYYLNADGVMKTGWLKLGDTWYFLNAGGVMQTGWLYNGGSWYYLKASGAMATGWVQVGNRWYYLNAGGVMKTGWLQQGSTWYYLKANGTMATGWNWVDSKCYYFGASGKMAANTTVGGYKLDASGAWVK